MSIPTHQLIFVCTGNTCRSPMAERLMRDLLPANTAWEVGSAGVAAANGAPASEFALKVIQEKGLDLSTHKARQVTSGLLKQADLIVTMTRSHLEFLQMQHDLPADKCRTLSDCVPGGQQADIIDPFGGTLDTYRLTRDEIEQILMELVLELQETL